MQDGKETTAKNFFFTVKRVDYGAYLVHGFSAEKLKVLSGGKTFKDHIDEIEKDFLRADVVVTHNTAFDLMFLRREFERVGRELVLKGSFCTMKSTVSLCKLSRTGGGYKYPKLSELCDFLGIDEKTVAGVTRELFSEDAGYHDARFDTAAVYLIVNEGRSKSSVFDKVSGFLS